MFLNSVSMGVLAALSLKFSTMSLAAALDCLPCVFFKLYFKILPQVFGLSIMTAKLYELIDTSFSVIDLSQPVSHRKSIILELKTTPGERSRTGPWTPNLGHHVLFSPVTLPR